MLQVLFMEFVLIWHTRPGFCRTDCNALVFGYTIAGFLQGHITAYMATCNGCLSSYTSSWLPYMQLPVTIVCLATSS